MHLDFVEEKNEKNENMKKNGKRQKRRFSAHSIFLLSRPQKHLKIEESFFEKEVLVKCYNKILYSFQEEYKCTLHFKLRQSGLFLNKSCYLFVKLFLELNETIHVLKYKRKHLNNIYK